MGKIAKSMECYFSTSYFCSGGRKNTRMICGFSIQRQIRCLFVFQISCFHSSKLYVKVWTWKERKPFGSGPNPRRRQALARWVPTKPQRKTYNNNFPGWVIESSSLVAPPLTMDHLSTSPRNSWRFYLTKRKIRQARLRLQDTSTYALFIEKNLRNMISHMALRFS